MNIYIMLKTSNLKIPPHIIQEELRHQDFMEWKVPKATDMHSRIRVHNMINEHTYSNIQHAQN
jgi:hypothetical protein